MRKSYKGTFHVLNGTEVIGEYTETCHAIGYIEAWNRLEERIKGKANVELAKVEKINKTRRNGNTRERKQIR